MEPRHGKITLESMNEPYPLFRLSTTLTCIVVSAYTLTLLIAFIGKYTIFRVIANTGIKQKPINLLILVDQGVNTLHRSMMIISCIITMILQYPLVDIFGPTYCLLFQLVVIFGPLYKVPGSLGINIFRLCYLKMDIGAIERVNWTVVAVLILISSLALNSTSTVLLHMHPPLSGAVVTRLAPYASSV